MVHFQENAWEKWGINPLNASTGTAVPYLGYMLITKRGFFFFLQKIMLHLTLEQYRA